MTGYYEVRIPYFEKFIPLRDNDEVYASLCDKYYKLLSLKSLENFADARQICEKSCYKDNEKSCYTLGLMYYESKGVPQNYSVAIKSFKKACDMENAEACKYLGELYGKGKGIKQNLYKPTIL